MNQKINDWMKELTLEEKASLCAGLNMWMTKGIDRLNIPPIHMYDGTNGIRKTNSDEEMGIATTGNIPATCYPTGSAIGSSWNTELLHEVGVALGVEGKEMGVELLLGPGINMKRTPLGGRNFEYYSEDPCLSGELGAAFVNGLQSQGVGASVKHFACNNQEFEKMVTSSEVDERTLREIYLSAFERIIKKADPWTVMCSYNLLNGSYTSENEHLLDDILRKEWGYEGVVLSDWTAVNDRIRGLKAGLDIEMPGPAHYNADAIVKAVQNGTLSEEHLNNSVRRILTLVEQVTANEEESNTAAIDYHELARKAAAESIVLLKNDNGILPIDPAKTQSIAVIGTFAKKPRIQGAGSAEVTPTRVDIPWDEVQKIAGESVQFSYADGYPKDERIDEAMIQESAALAAKSDLAILFVGQPEYAESEMRDLASIDLPEHQVKLIQAVAAAQPRCVVVTSSGTAMAMRPWVQHVPGVLHSWLTGQGSGRAIAEILFGLTNPSGKLSETFPVKLSDNPSHMRIRGENGKLYYREGLFVGYRYYDRKELAPQFPFGHGLSYTTFAYSDMKVKQHDRCVTVSLQVENTGTVAGKEVVQLYVHDEECKWTRPEKELKAFAKIELQPHEKKEVVFELEERDFAYYNTKYNRWVAETGYFKLAAGSSSRDIRLTERVFCDFGKEEISFHKFSLLNDWIADPLAKSVLEKCFNEMNKHVIDQVVLNEGFVGFWGDFPAIKVLQMFGQNWLVHRSPDQVMEELIAEVERERRQTVQ
ncbi:glycoside hydrolase family 3 C-terminal domain-containing protein [Paenibacillus alvei]|uniref:Glycoside hydrolase family 3 C-terminal domain-containing protein n=2 Tax=Paenibacillus TaxID=44249 RepID=A0ABT4GTH3_PAEAL|nr:MULTISPECIES: glycoside hydrolase family 3 C-terminal domain-containing protein [Paenibacillus]MCY7483300.1 glycoside hydrolase family 3 C-terminal domain-containing protein [Paenibacillus alvei]MCY9759990.1 glycoside hydrolase family 3 C-terminal domain-containing protein [Paenibacillus alvei]MCY9768200.1 glycoside hydrolase family 3 C-terminal domain-containing protein [Paenibacillus alvei]